MMLFILLCVLDVEGKRAINPVHVGVVILSILFIISLIAIAVLIAAIVIIKLRHRK